MEAVVSLAAIVGVVAIVAIVFDRNLRARSDHDGIDLQVGKKKL